jgi:hypothetical protein
VHFPGRQPDTDRLHRLIDGHPTRHGKIVFSRQGRIDEARRDNRDGNPFGSQSRRRLSANQLSAALDAP